MGLGHLSYMNQSVELWGSSSAITAGVRRPSSRVSLVLPSSELGSEWEESADPGAVTGVLRRYSLPVREFRHSAIGEASFRHSDRWLRLLVLKGVQTLKLEFRTLRLVYHTLHPSIFSCRELTALDLEGCDVPATPPGFEGLPNLTVLRLSGVRFAGVRDLQLLIAKSPLLERLYLVLLRIYSDDENDRWVFLAPKLLWFSITDIFYYGWKISDLPSLEGACIECPFDHDFVKHMAGLARVRDLKVQIQVDDDNILEGLSCPFNDLKSLTLDTSLSLFSSVLSYPVCSGMLQNLKIYILR